MSSPIGFSLKTTRPPPPGQGKDAPQGPIQRRFMPFFRKFWPHLAKDGIVYGRAIEEVDPFVFEDTFCIISAKFSKNYIFRFSSTRSLFIFSPLNPLRQLCIKLITNQLFDLFIIATILVNCVALAFDNNKLKIVNGVYEAEDYDLEKGVELTFLAVYTLEMSLKIVAKGFVFNKFSYLRNGWNILDFIVVVCGFITEILEYLKVDYDLDVLRTFRVLRAVKTISILPGLRLMINALLNSILQLIEVMALTFFCLCIFALFALEVYMGKLHSVCVLDWDAEEDYGGWVTNTSNWLERDFPKAEFVPCSNDTGGRSCPSPYTCLPNLSENPDDGWTSFDTFLSAMLSTFQLITLDFWERLFELVMSTSGPWCMPFFIMVVFLGSFYLLNLMLAVVAMSYEAEAHSWHQPLSRHQKLTLHRTDSSFSFTDVSRLQTSLLTTASPRTTAEREQLARTLRNASMGKRKPQRVVKRKLLLNRETKGSNKSMVSGVLGERVVRKKTAKDSDKASGSASGGVMALVKGVRGGAAPSSTVPAGGVLETPATSPGSRHRHSPLLPLEEYSVEDSPPEEISKLDMASWTEPPVVVNPEEVPPGKYDLLPKLKKKLTPYVNNWLFEAFITTSIVLNTVLLATEHHGQPQWLEEWLETGGMVFTSIFAGECVIKIIILQSDYFKQNWNLFDLVIVLASLLDMFIDTAVTGSNTIRSFRLLRIFKLAQSWITMKVLLNIIFSTFGALGNLTLVLAIVIYIFAILGMQIIGNKYTPERFDVHDPDDPEFPRWNFQDFYYAFMMVFRVLCGEWIEPLWDCLKAHKNDGEWKCFVIFLPILIIGNFIVLNLFLALLLNSFNTEELKAQREKEKSTSNKSDNLKSIVSILLNRKRPTPIPAITVKAAEEPNTPNARFKAAALKVIEMNRRKADKEVDKGILKGSKPLTASIPPPHPCLPQSLTCCTCPRRWMLLRSVALRIVSHPFFEWGILILILASSITLCFEDIYLEENAELKMALFVLNNFFTMLFVIEMIIKWMAMGLAEYFTTFWTILDIFIVMVSVITLVFDIQNESWNVQSVESKNLQGLGALKALRTLRALRPLRAISRWQGMKVVVNALMYAIPSIFNVLLVCLLFWLVFAIMGVQFYKGKFHKCVWNNGTIVRFEVIPNRTLCCSNPETSWINTSPNFDNVFEGYLSLFQVATFEGWIELMRATTDSHPTDVDQNFRRDQNFVNYGFYVIFIIFGSFFTLNLFIGVIIDNFNMLKKKYEGNLLEALLTPSQRRYYTAMKKLGRKKPRRVIRRPSSHFFALFYDISMSRRFEIAIFILIFLNMVVMSFEHHNQSAVFVHILAGCNSFFSTIYALEACVKILGLRHFYFTIPWNLFDFCLVLFSIVDLFLVDADLKIPFPPTLLRVVRVFRIGRVLRLVKVAKGIRKLLFALIVSLPALFNIGALLALITFIYAILGMALFKDAVANGAIDEVFSFQTFWKSSLMLFRLMTAAGWNEVLDALILDTPLCGTYRKFNCGGPNEPECISRIQSVLYMVSYIIISFLIVINMYIAIILENFVEANKDEEVGIIEDDLEMFYVRWSRYDPTASQFIAFDQLSEFLASLDPPLDIPKPNLVAIVSFDLPIARGNKIHCLDILHSLVKHVLGHVDDSEEFRKIQDQMEHKFRKQFPSRKLLDIVSSTRIWKVEQNAAICIQRAWRAHLNRANPPVEKAKSTQTRQHGFGNMMNRMGHFFHHEGRRRRSSVVVGLSASAKGSRGVMSPTQPRNSSSSQSSCSPNPESKRRLSPSRLSGGSFEVAVNYGSSRLLSVAGSKSERGSADTVVEVHQG